MIRPLMSNNNNFSVQVKRKKEKIILWFGWLIWKMSCMCMRVRVNPLVQGVRPCVCVYVATSANTKCAPIVRMHTHKTKPKQMNDIFRL